MKEKEVIKTFLEWTKKNNWINLSGNDWVKRKFIGDGEYATTEYLFDLYEQETKQYTVGEVYDQIYKSWDERWELHSDTSQKTLTAFAERYHELKTQNRIK